MHQALLGNNWQITEVIKEASKYPTSTNKQQPVQVKTPIHINLTLDQEDWLNLLASHPPKQARQNSKALYARLYRKHRDWLLDTNYQHAAPKEKSTNMRVDWDKRDREYLHALRQLIVFLQSKFARASSLQSLLFQPIGKRLDSSEEYSPNAFIQFIPSSSRGKRRTVPNSTLAKCPQGPTNPI